MKLDEFKNKYDLFEITEDDGFILDLKYATPDNFLNEILYDYKICLIKSKTAKKLFSVRDELKKYNLKLKIWDAFRTINVQEKMWNICPDETFVANPKKSKSNHCKGIAVDVTLCDLEGKELKMPTEFDCFNDTAKRNYFPNLEGSIRKNVTFLEEIMVKNGFEPYENEWWHYNDIEDSEVIFEKFEN